MGGGFFRTEHFSPSSHFWIIIFISSFVLISAEAARSENKNGAVAATKDYYCPLTSAKEDFDLSQFSGDWYVLEYQYQKEMLLRDLSCVGLHFSKTSFGGILTNFTFRFPADTGYFYHVPTFSLVAKDEGAVWETQFRGVELLSIIVDTDYNNWAVLVQCSEQGGSSSSSSSSSKGPAFLSTRIMSRSRSLQASDWLSVHQAVERASASAPYRYPIDQGVCEELDED